MLPMIGDELAHTQRMLIWIAMMIKPIDINSFITRIVEIESMGNKLNISPLPFRKLLHLALAAQAFQTAANDALKEA